MRGLVHQWKAWAHLRGSRGLPACLFRTLRCERLGWRWAAYRGLHARQTPTDLAGLPRMALEKGFFSLTGCPMTLRPNRSGTCLISRGASTFPTISSLPFGNAGEPWQTGRKSKQQRTSTGKIGPGWGMVPHDHLRPSISRC